MHMAESTTSVICIDNCTLKVTLFFPTVFDVNETWYSCSVHIAGCLLALGLLKDTNYEPIQWQTSMFTNQYDTKEFG